MNRVKFVIASWAHRMVCRLANYTTKLHADAHIAYVADQLRRRQVYDPDSGQARPRELKIHVMKDLS